MDLGLKDKVAIIGGGSKGLGRACADVLAQEGAKLAICSRTLTDLEQAAAEIRQATGTEVMVFAGDLDQPETSSDLVAATVNHFGRLDILVNNSGGPPKSLAVTADEALWNIAIQRSFLFFTRMCRQAIPHLKQQNSGRIINVLSSSVYEPLHKLVLSGATRMGVVAYAKTLADELGPDNILVNNVCPGAILTERFLSNVELLAKDRGISVEEALNIRASKAALNRVGQPEEFANLVAFLASDKASFITGATYRIDGGAVRSLL